MYHAPQMVRPNTRPTVPVGAPEILYIGAHTPDKSIVFYETLEKASSQNATKPLPMQGRSVRYVMLVSAHQRNRIYAQAV